jgi:hypothetical protein
MLLWGIAMTSQGLIHNYSGLLGMCRLLSFGAEYTLNFTVARFFLGMFEAVRFFTSSSTLALTNA